MSTLFAFQQNTDLHVTNNSWGFHVNWAKPQKKKVPNVLEFLFYVILRIKVSEINLVKHFFEINLQTSSNFKYIIKRVPQIFRNFTFLYWTTHRFFNLGFFCRNWTEHILSKCLRLLYCLLFLIFNLKKLPLLNDFDGFVKFWKNLPNIL